MTINRLKPWNGDSGKSRFWLKILDDKCKEYFHSDKDSGKIKLCKMQRSPFYTGEGVRALYAVERDGRCRVH